MVDISNELLRKLQLTQLITFLEIKRICDKHDIRYTPIGGTLIGVVRHNGFIPWDDDIDLGMLREDFDKFLSVAETELSSDFFLQTNDTDAGYQHPIARICLNDTKMIEHCDVGVDMHHGIYTDIFPYDASPDSTVKMLWHKYMLKWLKLSNVDRHLHRNPRTLKGKILYPFFRLSTLPLSDKMVEELLYKQIKKYNNSNATFVVRSGSQYAYEKVRVPRKLMEEFVTMDFEGFTMSVMKGYHEHLTENYGDYMALPPEEKRNKAKTSIAELDLGKYNDMNYILERLNSYTE